MLHHLNQYLFRVLQFPSEVHAWISFVWKPSWMRDEMGKLQSQKYEQKMSDLALARGPGTWIGIISQCFSTSRTITSI